MVSQANTGANPWTVMVHSNNTSPTLAAVMRSRWFDSIATCAKLASLTDLFIATNATDV